MRSKRGVFSMKTMILQEVVLIGGVLDSPDTHRATWFSKVWDDFISEGAFDFDAIGCDPFARDCKLALKFKGYDASASFPSMLVIFNQPAIETEMATSTLWGWQP